MLEKRHYFEEREYDNTNIYAEDVREALLEDDELSLMEEAFMKGYEDAV